MNAKQARLIMKVEKEKTVKFTLELDPVEFLILKSFVGSVNGASDFRKACDNIYNALEEESKECVGGLLNHTIDGDKIKLFDYVREAKKL